MLEKLREFGTRQDPETCGGARRDAAVARRASLDIAVR